MGHSSGPLCYSEAVWAVLDPSTQGYEEMKIKRVRQEWLYCLKSDLNWTFFALMLQFGLLRWLSGKEAPCSAGDGGSIPGWGRFSRERNGNSLQYSCLENSKDRGTGGLQSMRSQSVQHDLVTEWLPSAQMERYSSIFKELGVGTTPSWGLGSGRSEVRGLHSSSGTLSDLIHWIYLSLILYNHKGFDLSHTWMV